jgi:hypothetical protein
LGQAELVQLVEVRQVRMVAGLFLSRSLLRVAVVVVRFLLTQHLVVLVVERLGEAVTLALLVLADKEMMAVATLAETRAERVAVAKQLPVLPQRLKMVEMAVLVLNIRLALATIMRAVAVAVLILAALVVLAALVAAVMVLA